LIIFPHLLFVYCVQSNLSSVLNFLTPTDDPSFLSPVFVVLPARVLVHFYYVLPLIRNKAVNQERVIFYPRLGLRKSCSYFTAYLFRKTRKTRKYYSINLSVLICNLHYVHVKYIEFVAPGLPNQINKLVSEQL
jgi:hypothetical protein